MAKKCTHVLQCHLISSICKAAKQQLVVTNPVKPLIKLRNYKRTGETMLDVLNTISVQMTTLLGGLSRFLHLVILNQVRNV